MAQVKDPGSGGFRPSLVTVPDGLSAGIEFLASENATYKRGGVTLDATAVVADGNGDKAVAKGTLLGVVTIGGKYVAYDDAAITGEEVAVGILNEDVNLRDGDVIAGMLIQGVVLSARVTGYDAAAAVDLPAITFLA